MYIQNAENGPGGPGSIFVYIYIYIYILHLGGSRMVQNLPTGCGNKLPTFLEIFKNGTKLDAYMGIEFQMEYLA